MSERYPSCPKFKSVELFVHESASGDRTWHYRGPDEAWHLEADDIDQTEIIGATCVCGHEIEPEEIVWHEPEE